MLVWSFKKRKYRGQARSFFSFKGEAGRGKQPRVLEHWIQHSFRSPSKVFICGKETLIKVTDNAFQKIQLLKVGYRGQQVRWKIFSGDLN